MTRTSRSPLRPLHVVVAGGGIAGVEALLALRALTGDALSLTLVSPAEQLHYRPFTVLEPFSARATRHYDLDEICADLDVTRRRDALAAVDGEAREIVTEGGERIAYDALVLAPGARAGVGLAHAHTFFADADPESLHWIVQELEQGAVRRVAFVLPPGSTWPLPLYELALMTAARVRGMGVEDAELTIVTPEDAPLGIFHGAGSAAVGERLAAAGIRFLGSAYAHDYDGATLALTPGERTLEVERVVALPVLSGPSLGGLPSDRDGFVHVDERGRVPGLADVYAVGDATTFAIKQGGIAAQQADAVATLIARAAGARVPEPSTRPLLRAVLFTGDGPLYLRATIAGGESVVSSASRNCPCAQGRRAPARALPGRSRRDRPRDRARPSARGAPRRGGNGSVWRHPPRRRPRRHRAARARSAVAMSDPLRRVDSDEGAPPRVLVAGGGVGALETVLALRANAGMRVEVELVTPDPELRYPPLDVVEPFGLVPPRLELAPALAPLGVGAARPRGRAARAVRARAREGVAHPSCCSARARAAGGVRDRRVGRGALVAAREREGVP